MIKLKDLLELEMKLQPGELSKLHNYLYRGTRDQIDQIMEPYDDEGSTTYSKMKGTIEEEPLTTDHPENKERIVGWGWDEKNTLEEEGNECIDIRGALLGRELQTLQDVKKLVTRLRDRGYDKKAILSYVVQYLDALDEDIAYATITKPAVSGGLTQDSE